MKKTVGAKGRGQRKRCRGSFWVKLAELILEAHSTDRASIVNIATPVTLMGSTLLLSFRSHKRKLGCSDSPLARRMSMIAYITSVKYYARTGSTGAHRSVYAIMCGFKVVIATKGIARIQDPESTCFIQAI